MSTEPIGGAPAAAAIPAEPAPQRPLAPIAGTERIRSLDVLRGVAILGIFFVNVQFFAMPLVYAFADDRLPDAPILEQLSWGFIKVFCEYKFISTFSLLFGAGLVMQMMRAEAAGRGFVWRYLRRMAVLALFGLAHGLLLWYGDILLMYAVLGTVLVFFRRVQVRTLLILAAILLLTGMLLGLGFGMLQVFFAPPESAMEATDTTLRGMDAILAAQFQPFHESWIIGEIAAYSEGPLADVFAFRTITYGFAVFAALQSYGWHVFAMFLIGAALMKLDFFRPHRAALQRRVMVWGLALGLPIELANALIITVNDHQLNVVAMVVLPLREIGSVALCLGYVGGIASIVSAGRCGAITGPVSCVGRMALSTYLLTTVAATGLMYWWGLGWFNSVSRLQQIGLVLLIYACLVVFSMAWLSVMRMGPFEWLWRSITYMRPQPLLRARG